MSYSYLREKARHLLVSRCHRPPFPHVCPFESGFAGVEGGSLVQSGQATQEEIDKADRNGDGLICYKIVNGSNVILIEMLPF